MMSDKTMATVTCSQCQNRIEISHILNSDLRLLCDQLGRELDSVTAERDGAMNDLRLLASIQQYASRWQKEILSKYKEKGTWTEEDRIVSDTEMARCNSK